MSSFDFENISAENGPPSTSYYYTYVEIDNKYLYANFSSFFDHSVKRNYFANTSKVIFYPSKYNSDYFLEVYEGNSKTPLNTDTTKPYELDLSKYDSCRICSDGIYYRGCWRIYPSNTKVTIEYDKKTIKDGGIILPFDVVYDGSARRLTEEITYRALCKDKKMDTDLKIERYNLKCANKRMLDDVTFTIEQPFPDADKFFSLSSRVYDREFKTDGTKWQEWANEHKDEFIEDGIYINYRPGDFTYPICELDIYGKLITTSRVKLDDDIIPFGWYGLWGSGD